ncbi:MAG: hypothetical protein Q9213_002916 [Squamulea squamosa]
MMLSAVWNELSASYCSVYNQVHIRIGLERLRSILDQALQYITHALERNGLNILHFPPPSQDEPSIDDAVFSNLPFTTSKKIEVYGWKDGGCTVEEAAVTSTASAATFTMEGMKAVAYDVWEKDPHAPAKNDQEMLRVQGA